MQVARILARSPHIYEAALGAKHRLQSRTRERVIGINSQDQEEVFSRIYADNGWGDAESRSGAGSSKHYTRRLRDELPSLIKELGVKRLLDAPCGDLVWMRDVSLPDGVEYLGADIVSALIDDLGAEFSGTEYRFMQLDIVRDPLPRADLWLCRDCLIHLPNEAALAALDNFARSNIKYLLTTTFNFPYNKDIATGEFRMINLRRPPFLLPRPLHSFFDFVYPYPPRRLVIYSNEQLREWSRNRRRMKQPQ